MKLLGIETDKHLNTQSHVSTICKKAAGQSNALSRLKSFLNQDQRNLIANSFIYSKSNYCPLIRHFCSQRLINKIENIQKRPLRFVLNDYTSNYGAVLTHYVPALHSYRNQSLDLHSISIDWFLYEGNTDT